MDIEVIRRVCLARHLYGIAKGHLNSTNDLYLFSAVNRDIRGQSNIYSTTVINELNVTLTPIFLIEIDGVKAFIQYDPDIDMLRGEFIGLNGG